MSVAGLREFEPLLRLGALAVVFVAVTVREALAPFHLRWARARRWPNPIGAAGAMRIGVERLNSPEEVRLWRLLVQPLHATDPRSLLLQKEHS